MTTQGELFLKPGVPAKVERVSRKAATARDAQAKTVDSFQNFGLNLGMGTNNALAASTYGFNPTTRNRILLEWMYRGSGFSGLVVDIIPNDMTREGVDVLGDLKPEQIEEIHRAASSLGIMNAACETAKWSRLYGGAIGVILIDGQDPGTPLREDTIKKGQFKGIKVFDRWWITPSVNDLVSEYGPNMGLPKFYTIAADAPGLRNKTVHYSRVLRMTGLDLPYNQQIAEDLWGESVLERLFDRMVMFDSASQGAAQLVYKSAIRTYKVKGMRDLIAAGADAGAMLAAYTELMRKFQGIEGVTLLDAEDDMVIHHTHVQAGISDALMQFGQQISGITQIPLVRLFGQSPAGLNSTGESDLRTYYDNVKNMQNQELREPLLKVYRCLAISLGFKVDGKFNIDFRPLWQMDDTERADYVQKVSQTIYEGEAIGLLKKATALRELKQLGRPTGIFTNITDDEIADAEKEDAEAPDANELLEQARNAGGEPGTPKALKDKSKKVDGDLPSPGGRGVRSTPAGDVRRGNGWAIRMPADYGFIRGTSSAEGENEAMDCFIGPERGSKDVYVIDGQDPFSGEFGEHKVMLGCASQDEAEGLYRLAYHDALVPIRCTRMSLDGLRRWMRTGDVTRPLSKTPTLVAVR